MNAPAPPKLPASSGAPSPGLYDLLDLIWELYTSGGVTITTPPLASLREGDPILAMTVIQPDGDVIVRISDEARGDPSVWARHLAAVDERLSLLQHVPSLTEQASRLQRWSRFGATGLYHVTLAGGPSLFASAVGGWVYTLVAGLVLTALGHFVRHRFLRVSLNLAGGALVWSVQRRRPSGLSGRSRSGH